MVSQWFKVREGLATGCVTVGSAIGGIFFSLVLQELFIDYEWRTGVLILAGIIMAFMTIGNLLVERNESQQTAAETDGGGWDFTALREMSKSPKFWLICVSIFGMSAPGLLPCRHWTPNQHHLGVVSPSVYRSTNETTTHHCCAHAQHTRWSCSASGDRSLHTPCPPTLATSSST